jgi:hypothetical protein
MAGSFLRSARPPPGNLPVNLSLTMSLQSRRRRDGTGESSRQSQEEADGVTPAGFFSGWMKPPRPRRLFHRVGDPMNYPAFTNDSLTMMYEGIRGALASDDALTGLGEEPRFRVRVTPDWKQHAADLEAEMLKRGMMFDVIDWSEDQATVPFKP